MVSISSIVVLNFKFQAESKSNVVIQDSSNKDKRSSIWNWKKPLKALTHIRSRGFNCCFFLHVHAIEGLTPTFNNLNLCITWKKKADVLRTRPARVCSGNAEFEETLMHQCSVYDSRSGAHNSAKYEPKIFLLHVSAFGAANIDIGNHWIDLSRLLPLKLEELEGDKRSSGKWTTSFKLRGEAKGAILNFSFGFSITGGNLFEPDVDFIEDILPNQESELSHSVTLLYQKLDEAKKGNELDFDDYEYSESPRAKFDPSHDFNDTEIDVIEEAVEESTKDEMEKTEKLGSQRFDDSVIETIDVAEIFEGEETDFDEDVEWHSNLDKINAENQNNCLCIIEPDFQELESASRIRIQLQLKELQLFKFRMLMN
ncbi:hypothetical protein BUALT_Bualt05G0007800 [Buddleja alternifolia]|uniref:C2 NT-type domain-containing protein n=1 Tax=Buddleja alternifolia TaxID=168488 RepID=A0AAV6XF98_9LAMI|nr:hypothetical protein BUALT_Bualt05G0007800 [Buddleja alternifolia]